jgi:hypothetical protein
MHPIGFSTGAIARGDFRSALALIDRHALPVVELSALRVGELRPLVEALPTLDLRHFAFVSVHAPSRFTEQEEESVVGFLTRLTGLGYCVIAHPDMIFQPEQWEPMGDRLLIENMDKRKSVGRTAEELAISDNCLTPASALTWATRGRWTPA